MAKYTVAFLIDNDAPYDFSDIGLAPYILSMSVSCGGKYAPTWQRDGNATLTLDNSDRLFDPHNTSSIFFDKLLTKRRVRIFLNNVLFWTGVIENLTPSIDTKNPIVNLTLSQGLQNLKNIFITGKIYENKNGKQIAQALIDDSVYVPVGVDPVFILDYSEVGDNLTLDHGAEFVNEIFTDIIYPYASDTWTIETSLYTALEELMQAEQATGHLSRAGRITCLPFWHVRTETIVGTENIDNSAISANFVSNTNITNTAIAGYYTRKILTDGEVETQTLDVEIGIIFELTPTALETEQKRSILGNVKITQGNDSVRIVEWDARRVRLEGKVTLSDVTVTVTADILTIGNKSVVTVDNQPSLDRYRYRYKEEYNYKLISTRLAANTVASRALSRNANPFTYVESMRFVNNYPYEIGDVILINSALLPAGGSRHIILGEEHTLSNDTIKTVYYMMGVDSATVFVLDESLLDSDDFIL